MDVNFNQQYLYPVKPYSGVKQIFKSGGSSSENYCCAKYNMSDRIVSDIQCRAAREYCVVLMK